MYQRISFSELFLWDPKGRLKRKENFSTITAEDQWYGWSGPSVKLYL